MTITLTELQDELILSPLRCSDGNGTLSYLFFSEEYVDVQRAKAICAKCSSRQDCLSAALDRAEPWGVWGGELLEDGQDPSLERLLSPESKRCRFHSTSDQRRDRNQARCSR